MQSECNILILRLFSQHGILACLCVCACNKKTIESLALYLNEEWKNRTQFHRDASTYNFALELVHFIHFAKFIRADIVAKVRCGCNAITKYLRKTYIWRYYHWLMGCYILPLFLQRSCPSIILYHKILLHAYFDSTSAKLPDWNENMLEILVTE